MISIESHQTYSDLISGLWPLEATTVDTRSFQLYQLVNVDFPSDWLKFHCSFRCCFPLHSFLMMLQHITFQISNEIGPPTLPHYRMLLEFLGQWFFRAIKADSSGVKLWNVHRFYGDCLLSKTVINRMDITQWCSSNLGVKYEQGDANQIMYMREK